MDHLKAVGKAIKNSPKAIRKKITGTGASDGHESKLSIKMLHRASSVLLIRLCALVHIILPLISKLSCIGLELQCRPREA